jgi:hypothetical protein
MACAGRNKYRDDKGACGVQMAYSKRWLVDLLRRLGYTQAADDALREMPDEFDLKQLQEFGDRHGISRDDLSDAMGGSP